MGCVHKAYNVGENHCNKNTCGVRVRGMLSKHATWHPRAWAISGNVWWSRSTRKRVKNVPNQEPCGGAP